MSNLEQFAVLKRYTRTVKFTAKIVCKPTASNGAKLGLTVQWALRNGVSLNGCDLRGADLRDVSLNGCDLRGADLRECKLSECTLSGCTLRYANLSGCNLSGCNLSGCDLSGCDLSGCDLRGADLSDAELSWCDLGNSDLSNADLRWCDLSNANLRGTDLRGARFGEHAIKIKNIHRTVYDAASQPGALDMTSWHCGTAHCRAGWVVALAGKAGAELEAEVGTSMAATLIYFASDPKLEKVPNFYADGEDALADMKRLAEMEDAA